MISVNPSGTGFPMMPTPLDEIRVHVRMDYPDARRVERKKQISEGGMKVRICEMPAEVIRRREFRPQRGMFLDAGNVVAYPVVKVDVRANEHVRWMLSNLFQRRDEPLSLAALIGRALQAGPCDGQPVTHPVPRSVD